MIRPRPVIGVLLVLLSWGVVKADEDFALKDGDRVVFYGDSITDQRLYTTFVETYAVTRFPNRELTFIHSGWGGDRVTGGGGGPIDRRLKRDVIAYQPTVLTIMLGMNDARYQSFKDEIFQTYSDGFRKILRQVREALPDVRITLIQPSPFDDVTREPNFEGGYNAVLVRYGEFVKELATEEKVDSADLNTPVVAALEKAKESDPATAEKLIPDRVHPDPGGHLLMAEALLKAWNAPALVTSVELDAEVPEANKVQHTTVSDLEKDGAHLNWTQEDEALPLPIDLNDPIMALAVRSSDVMEALNRQPLKVANLESTLYALVIDGQQVGRFTREELAEGINLAALPTPMIRQAAQVHALTLKHNDLHFKRWRTFQVPLQDQDLPHLQQALDGLDALESDYIRQQREAARPQPRHYELIPQT